MSTALEELKLFLLQHEWDDNNEAIADALQLLLGVAEMKTKNKNQMMSYIDSHADCAMDIAYDNDDLLNISNEKIFFCDSDEDDDESNEDDKKTEIYFTADENYDVSV